MMTDHAELAALCERLRSGRMTDGTRIRAAMKIEALLSEIAALRGERDEADRRAGAAERELADKTDSITKRSRWLRGAKEARGYHQNVSFNLVWAETCSAADRATQAERQRNEAVGLLRRIVETPSEEYDDAKEADAIRAFLANQGADQ